MGDIDERPGEVAIDARVQDDGEASISVAGEVDSANAGQLEAAVEAMLAQSPRALNVEMSGLRFIDSAGIAVLVRAAARFELVRLSNPSAIVRKTVEATGLSGVLRVEP